MTLARLWQHPVWRLGSIGFFLSFIANLFVLLGMTLFLKLWGPNQLPVYYILFNVLSIALGLAFFAINLPGSIGLSFTSGGMALFLIVAGFTYQSYPKPLVFMLFVFSGLFFMYSMIFFWNRVNHSLGLREIERYSGRITAGILLGTVLAGLAIKPLFHFLGEDLLLYIAGVALAGFAFSQFHAQEYPTGLSLSAFSSLKLLFPREVLELDLIKLLFTTSFLFGLIRVLGDFQFSQGVAQHFQDPKALSGFLGTFHAAMNAGILVWQVVFLRRVLKNWPIITLYAVIAGILLGASVICLAFPQLIPLIIFQAASLFLTKALKQPSQNLFIKSVPPGILSRANFLIGGIAESVTFLLAGVLIAGLNHFHSAPALFFGICGGLAIAALHFSLKLKWPYSRMLVKHLKAEQDFREPRSITKAMTAPLD